MNHIVIYSNLNDKNMNKDIVYEILKHLYLGGEAAIAKSLFLSTKNYRDLEVSIKKLEKPVVLAINGDSVDFANSFISEANIYWGDGTMNRVSKIDNTEHKYNSKNIWIIRIFDNPYSFTVPYNAEKIYSVGDMISLNMFFDGHSNVDKFLDRKWDTSKINNMSYMFSRCQNLNIKFGKYWDTSNVTNMRSMFQDCKSLNKNVGKYWDTSRVINMNDMFAFCEKLNKSVGKKWNTKNVEVMTCMFLGCTNLAKPVGQNWDLSRVSDMRSMFEFCKKFKQSWINLLKIPPKADARLITYGCLSE